MSIKKLSKEEVIRLTSIKEEIHNRIPFTTPYQSEVQRIVKELWKEQEGFFHTHGKLWINQQVANFDNKFPLVKIYSKMGKSIDNHIIYQGNDEDYIEEGFHVEIMNFEKYSHYEDGYINIIGTEDEDLKGIALYAIIDMLSYDYSTISNLHEKIIKIYKSNLDTKTQKSCIALIMKEIDNYIDQNSYKFNFKYQFEVIRNLNDLHLYYDWIEEEDSFIIQLALESYQEITYYNEWIFKHGVEEKRFKEKIQTIARSRQEIRKLTNARPPFHGKLPQHPQDIIYDLVSNYQEYYGRIKMMEDDGIQSIIKIISEYQRMPKKSIFKKALEREAQELDKEVIELRKKGLSKIEIAEYRVSRIFGKPAKYIGDTSN